LQHVDSQQRLSACALVSQKLAKAAAAATQSVSLSCYDSPGQFDGFLAWTNSHGSSLTKLHLSDMPDSTVIRQLACPNLLELSPGSVQLVSSEHLGLLHSCTALKKLDVGEATLLDGDSDGLAEEVKATAMPQLKFLMCCTLPQPTAFLRLIDRHGSSLTYLYLANNLDSIPSHSPVTMRQLPCPNLVELTLHDWSAQLCASSEGLGLLHSCTALTLLQLCNLALLDGTAEGPAAGAPAAAANLKELWLGDCILPDGAWYCPS
jgi:hypothetical protein